MEQCSGFYLKEYQWFIRTELLHTLGAGWKSSPGLPEHCRPDLPQRGSGPLRLAEIYERQGERQKAREHYARFAELWKDCDPELRPLVEEARRRMAK